MSTAILTANGLAAIASAIANDTQISINEIAVGDGNGAMVTPNAAQTTLVREVWRNTPASVTVADNNPNHIRAKLTIPAAVGGWVVREVGLYDATGTLIAVGNVTGTASGDGIPKPGPADATPSILDLFVFIEVSNAGAFEIKVDLTDTSQFLRTDRNLDEIANNGIAAQESARQNLGLLTDDFLKQLAVEIHKREYPVGALYLSTAATSPAVTLGFGTWELYGAGRVLVGLDPSDTDFNAIGKTGGAKTVALTEAQMPKHRATIAEQTLITSNTGAHTHSVSLDSELVQRGTGRVADKSGEGQDGSYPPFQTGSAGSHQHTVTIPAHQSAEMGGGAAHTNLQPYTVVAVWRRIV